MGIYLSPGVYVVERDLTTVAQASSTNITAYSGRFTKGPVNIPTLITNDRELKDIFGAPNINNYEDYLSVKNFLQYGNKIYVVRVVNEDGISTSASVNHTSSVTTIDVASTTNFPISGKLRLNNSELVSYSGKTGTSFLNVVRGIAGTTAASLTSGDTVTQEPENASLSIASDSSPFVDGVAATGIIFAGTAATLTDEDNIAVSDGDKTVTLALDLTARENAAFTVDAGTDVITTTLSLSSGDAFTVSTTGTLPAASPSLSATAVYYYGSDGKIYESYADALALSSAVDITDTGTGVHTATRAKGSGTSVSGAIPVDITADNASSTVGSVNVPLNYMLNDLYKITLVDATNFQTCPFSLSDNYLGTLVTPATAETNFEGSVISTSGGAKKGIVRHKSGNVVYVQALTGVFAAGDAVDNANTFTAIDTYVTAVTKMLDITTYNATTKTFTAAANIVTLSSEMASLIDGAPVQLTTTGTLPTGTALSTTYYVRYESGSTTTLKLYTTMDAALSAGTPVTISGAGSGTHTLTLVGITLFNDNSGENAEDGNVDIEVTEAGSLIQTYGMIGGVNPEYHRDAFITRFNVEEEPLATPTYADQEVIKVYAKSPGTDGKNYSVSFTNPNDYNSAYAIGNSTLGVTFKTAVDVKPSDDRREFAMVVIETDKLGNQTIIEKYTVSLLETAKTADGRSNFAEDVINNQSPTVFIDVNPNVSGVQPIQTSTTDNPLSTSATTINVASTTGYPTAGRIKIDNELIVYTGVTSTSFTGCTRGADGTTAAVHLIASAVYEYNSVATVTNEALTGGADGIYSRDSIQDEVILGYGLFANPEDMIIDLIIDGGNCNNLTVQQYIIDLAATRLDAMSIINVPYSTIDYPKDSQKVTAMIDWRSDTLNRSSSYAAAYANWKLQYDVDLDRDLWVPLSGDIAGVYAYTDQVSDPWFPPGGFVRGRIKNVKRFAVKPTPGQRDELYKNGLNPVLSFKNDGPVVFGQKTLLARPSAFSRVNIRRLFLFMERAIAQAARYSLMELNDRFSRKQLVGIIEPFLYDIQRRRGLEGFEVQCNEENNPPQVRQNYELRCDIYVKPTYPIEAIELRFNATPLGVSFQEISKVA